MWSIENIGAVGSAGPGDALRPFTFQNLTPQFVSAERFTLSDSDERSPSFCIPHSTKFSGLNRQIPEVERLATLRKQTMALFSNRQKINFCKTQSRSVTATRVCEFSAFLTGTASRTEIAVTRLKQSTVPRSNRGQNCATGSGDNPEGTIPGFISDSNATIRRRARARSQQVYASSAVCYAYCMAPQFPLDKRAQAAPESVPVRAQSSQSAAGVGGGNAESIASRDNKWLKQFRGALRGTGPAEGEPIAAEGPKLVEEGVRSGLEAEALLVSETGERHLECILQAASESDSGIPRSRIFRTSDKLFESVAGTEAPQGVAALFRQHGWTFDDVMRGRASLSGAYRSDSPLIVVMAAVQDPGNVGTIVRSAEAFGASGVVGTRGAADPWSPKALRASAGSALRVPLLRGMAIPILLAQLRVAGVRILAAGSRSHDTAAAKDAGTRITDLRGGCAIFIGNEGAGLPSEVEHAADDWVSIAMNEDVESLNAGVAASVILFEAARQRRGA
jgi:TrmH family RNA methyltransferase